MKMPVALKVLILTMSFICSAFSQEAKLGKLKIEDAYIRSTAPAQSVAGGFMKIDNLGAVDQLISASSPSAVEVQLHEMSMDGNVMKMRQIKEILVPANSSTELKPGGLHLMLIGIKSPLKTGDSVPLKLKFTKAGEVEVRFSVKAIGSGH